MNKELTMKDWLESQAYEDQKAVISREINKHRVIIDCTVFKKTPEERALLYTLKKQWEATRLLCV